MLTDYLDRFAHLHTNKNRHSWPASTYYRAPHKPLLLLAVIDLFARGSIQSNLIELNPDLGELFTIYWSRLMPPDAKGNIALPFFHLRSEGFWHLVPRPGKEEVLANVRQIDTVNQLIGLTIGARLDDELYEQLSISEARQSLRNILITQYFAPELFPALMEQAVLNEQSFQYSRVLLDYAERKKGREKPLDADKYLPVARDQGFRRAVVTAYDHRCAVCGIRVLTPDGHTAIDAAHIVPWSVDHNDDPRNGMGLCRLCHWTFDEGLIGVSENYLVLTSRELASNRNVPGHFATFVGRGILGPEEKTLWPDLQSLEWHRKKVFRAR